MWTETTITIQEWEVDVNEISYDYVEWGTTWGQNYYDTPIKWDTLTTETELKVEKWEQVKIIKVKYNERRWVIERKDVSELTPIIFKTADEQRWTDTIEAIELENNELSLRSELLEEETWENSCFLDWEEIENWGDIFAYKLKTADSVSQCESASNRIERICNEWVLDWNEGYKYKECNLVAALTCWPENISWYEITAAVTNAWDDQIWEKFVYTPWQGSVTYKETVK